MGYPAFVKSCEQGYDGQNQWLLQNTDELAVLALKMPTLPPLVVEGAIRFDRELSLIVARSVSGDTAMYPLAENRHREGILLTSEVPAANISQQTQQQATDIANRLLDHWSYVGVLSIELFDEAGVLRVNELAPRVHNSGHWSQDAGVTSQFSNHLRAITDTHPGNTAPAGYAGMINLLGRGADPALLQAPCIGMTNRFEAAEKSGMSTCSLRSASSCSSGSARWKPLCILRARRSSPHALTSSGLA